MSAATRGSWWLAVVGAVVGLGLFGAPTSVQQAVRTGVLDGVKPGVVLVAWSSRLVRQCRNRWKEAGRLLAELEQTQKERDLWRQQAQKLVAALAVERERVEELQRVGTSPVQPVDNGSLVVTELVRARVLAPAESEWLSGRRLLGAGAWAGVRRNALVVEDQVVIDQGEDARLRPGLPVFAGRCVVGRVVEVGRLVSVVLPVTSSQFRAYARLARPVLPNTNGVSGKTSGGRNFGNGANTKLLDGLKRSSLRLGAQGLLQGDGKGCCRLTLVERTEPVQVGDWVLTAEPDEAFPFPMVYGQVVEAELPAGQPYWEIRVQPFVKLEQLRTVEVLRKRLNPTRAAVKTAGR